MTAYTMSLLNTSWAFAIGSGHGLPLNVNWTFDWNSDRPSLEIDLDWFRALRNLLCYIVDIMHMYNPSLDSFLQVVLILDRIAASMFS